MNTYTNSGSLFKNDRKQQENQPDYTGSWTDANGVEHWLSCWLKESPKTGKKFMSLSATPKEPQQAPVAQHATPASMDFDSDVPFSNYEYKTLV
jgi:hypothetical protein